MSKGQNCVKLIISHSYSFIENSDQLFFHIKKEQL